MTRQQRIAVAGALAALSLSATATADAATRCVGPAPGCSPTLQAALDAAQDGDVVQLGPGTFKGGVRITSSVTLAGAGASKTTIKGGGPVIRVGTPNTLEDPLTVRIEGVTVTGGLTRRYPDEYDFEPKDAIAAGGGIYVPFSNREDLDFVAADLTVVDTVVRGNRASPTESFFVEPEFCEVPPGTPGCQFAGAFGGGIDSAGPLHLVRTTVTGNRIGSAAAADDASSDAEGAGIELAGPGASLSMVDSDVTNNVAEVAPPNGRFAEGAGIRTADDPDIDVRSSRITGNRAVVRAAFPDGTETVAVGGGLINGVNGTARFTDSVIAGNSTRAINSAGFTQAWSGGLHINGTLDMRRTVVSRNVSSAGERNGTFDAYADSGGGEINGDNGAVSRVVDSSFLGNTTAATSGSGTATAGGGAIWSGTLDPGSVAMTGSLVAGNRVIVTSRSEANGSGGGIWNVGGFDLLRTKVLGNEMQLHGPAGLARGGGIFTDRYADDPGLPLTPRLSLTRSDVGANRIVASRGISRLAGGVFSTTPVALSNARIASNTPEPQCVCGGGAQRKAPSAPATTGTPRHRAGASQDALRRLR